ncbi:LysR family transcriptional regulator [Kouleothrix aurantiaca]|uniref:LysR family transcriptional regulator n=1 Tax=Kouleothrix aurantiaca TaxID=186479 RepID=A0A0P9CWZ3_9CHLR|nr:LysR family transcriptional regulator [Kouleothrix aurantiaca]
MLNTIHLQTFLAVVEAGNYSAAAERLHMSQPAVSQHIRALEDQLDHIRLFRRVGQQMLLTHAGEDLVVSAREMLALSARAEESIRALRGQISGRVTLGCTASSGEILLPGLLGAFRTHFPAITITVSIAPIEALLEGLETQQVQMLLIEEQQRRRGWESTLLGTERVVLIAPRGHALLHQEQVPPGMLREHPLVLPRSGTPLRRIIEDGLRRRGVGATDIHGALETDAIGMTLQAVRDGVGLAFIPQTRMTRGRDLAIVDLAGVNLQQDWHLLRSRERNAPRAVQALYTFMLGPDARRIVGKAGLKVPAE